MKIQGEHFVLDTHELINEWSIALTMLLENDKKLLESDVQERAIVHRVAVYLRERFLYAEKYGIYIDNEYNREGESNVKKPSNGDGKWIAPDIILHERGSAKYGNRNNIFWSEIKKNSGSGGADAKRIIEEIKSRKYTFGIYLYKLSLEKIFLDLYMNDDFSRHGYVYCFETKQLREDISNG